MDKKMYILPGDERIAASDAKEFVHELRTGSWMDSTAQMNSICAILPNVT